MTEPLVFPATLSTFARWGGHVFMVMFSIIAIGLAVFGYVQWQKVGWVGPAWLVFVAVLLLAVLISCPLMAPRGYAVDPEGILVLRHWPRTFIPADDLVAVEPIELRRVCKVCGCQGVYGGWGWFSSDKLSWFRAYITHTDRLVVLRLRRGTPVVVSPDDPEGFVRAANVLLRTPGE